MLLFLMMKCDYTSDWGTDKEYFFGYVKRREWNSFMNP